MDYVLIVFAVICAWAVLRVIGAERARRVTDMTVKAFVASNTPPAGAPAPPEKTAPHAKISHPPVRSKAGR
jgi:hypothetical protein